MIELIRMRAADIINIKLMKTGGISNAIRIADIASMYQMECMIGCMVETSVSVSAAVHVAVAKANVITKVDLGGPSLCAFNPVLGVAKVVSVTRHTANPLRAHADASLLISAHEERSYIEPLLYRSALQHLLDLIFVLLCEEHEERLARLETNLERIQHLLEP